MRVIIEENKYMCISRFIVILYISFLSLNLIASESEYSGNFSGSISCNSYTTDTLKENQLLYNGRIWRNLYYNVDGDQFLFSKAFMPGKIVLRGKVFTDMHILVDIYKDEILIPLSSGGVLQINKEMIDSFSINFLNKEYNFTRIQLDSLNSFVQVIYKEKTALYVKHTKKIDKLAESGQYDKFYQSDQTYFELNGKVYPVAGKRDLINVLTDKKEMISSFMRKNKLKISKTKPESYIPVLKYIDTILQ